MGCCEDLVEEKNERGKKYCRKNKKEIFELCPLFTKLRKKNILKL